MFIGIMFSLLGVPDMVNGFKVRHLKDLRQYIFFRVSTLVIVNFVCNSDSIIIMLLMIIIV